MSDFQESMVWISLACLWIVAFIDRNIQKNLENRIKELEDKK